MRIGTERLRSASRVALAALAPLLLAGCGFDLDSRQLTFATWQQNDPTPMPSVGRVPVSHAVLFAPFDLALSEVEREALDQFLRRYAIRSGDRVTLSVAAPAGADVAKLGNRVSAVRGELAHRGIGAIVATAPAAATPPIDAVVVTGQVLAVLPVDCPGYNQPVQFDFERQPLSNPGCSNANNLGVMVANPADLQAGGPIPPADGEGMSLSIQRYRAGKITPLEQELTTE